MASVLMGLLHVVLYCAIVVFIAFLILWVLRLAKFEPDANVLRWGQIIVIVLCLIVVIGFLLSLLPVGGGWRMPYVFRY